MKVTNNPNRKEYNMTGINVTPPPPGGTPPPPKAPDTRAWHQKKRFRIPGGLFAASLVIAALAPDETTVIVEAPAPVETTEAPVVEIDEPVVVETTEAPVPETTEAPAPETTTVAPAPETTTTTAAPVIPEPEVEFDTGLAAMRIILPELADVSDEDLEAEAQAICAFSGSGDIDQWTAELFDRWLEEPAGMPEVFFYDIELYASFGGAAISWQCPELSGPLFGNYT